ncbi:MAG: 4'-phosphopantetheinyl transferase superfamily protein [Lachnospiraceae bacterium]|nr:4'-phosphopantetheinyl transferase superfamily protein [Lachnospiraceae bacterium]
MKTRLYLLRLDFLRDSEVYEKMRGQVSLSRRLRADKYRLADDRIRSLGAGLLLEYATGHTDDECELGPNGKPYFPAYPDLQFSLSHSGMLAVCAVSDRVLGVDCQEIVCGKESFRLIAKRYFTEEEQEKVFRRSPHSEEAEDAFDPAAFSEVWTKREAYVKMTGEGLAALLEYGKEPCFFPGVPEIEDYCVNICLRGEEEAEAEIREVFPDELERK